MMRAAALTLFCLVGFGTAAKACTLTNTKLGISRVVEIDPATGPLFGRATKFENQPSFLKPGEVVLTFDDGPTPGVTSDVLRALEEHCTRATFFPIGQRALQFPDLVAHIGAAGHTIGSHTWSHPNNLRRLTPGAARDQIERGFAAIDLASTVSLAPFFRFPGLNDGRDLLAYTQSRKLAVFSVDVISDDSFTRSVGEIVANTRGRTRANNGGILLFHDLKQATADALPRILRNLKTDGFRVVHLVSATPFVRDKGYDSELEPRIAHERAKRAKLNAGSDGAAHDLPGVDLAPETPIGLLHPVTAVRAEQAPFDLKKAAAAKAEAEKSAAAVTIAPVLRSQTDPPAAVELTGPPPLGGRWRTTIGPGASTAKPLLDPEKSTQ